MYHQANDAIQYLRALKNSSGGAKGCWVNLPIISLYLKNGERQEHDYSGSSYALYWDVM